MLPRILACVFAMATVAGVLGFVTATSTPVREIEEHFELGRQLRLTGAFPAVLRPPGYPAFVAFTLAVRDAAGGGVRAGRDRREDVGAVLAAQGLLLVAAAGGVFWFFARDLGLAQAACVSVAFGANPFSIVLAQTLSYYWVHAVVVTAATLALALAAERPSRGRVAVAGALWGVATLIRPVSLILPAFVAIVPLARGRRSAKDVAGFVGWFTLGMAILIAPIAARNFAATCRLIPVNAQGGFGLWGVTLEKIPSRTGYLTWTALWTEHGLPVMARVLGYTASQPETIGDTVLLNDEFTRIALARMRAEPSIYAHNVAINFREMNLDRLGVWTKFFERAQGGGDLGDVPSLPPSRLARWGATSSAAWIVAMMVAAVFGIATSARADRPAGWAVLTVYATVVVAHSIVFLTPRYPYVKLPLLVLGAALALAWRPRLRATTAAAAAAAVWAVASTIALAS